MATRRERTKKAKAPSVRTEMATALVKKLSGAELSWKFGNAALVIDEKVFAFPNRTAEGLVLKLPEADVNELIESGIARHLIMGTRPMRQWLVIEDPLSSETLKLARTAMRYVASLPKTPAKKKN